MRITKQIKRCIFSAGISLLLIPNSFGEAYLIVYGLDSSCKTATPAPDAIAILDGGADSLPIGTNGYAFFPNISEGPHTIEVTARDSYRPRENCLNSRDPDNQPYPAGGNLRHIELRHIEARVALFSFFPIVTTSATIRDAWTGERLDEVIIEFLVNCGSESNIVYHHYPWLTTDGPDWSSDSAGNFPSNTLLYADNNYDLRLSLPGYETFILRDAIQDRTAGDKIDLGTLLLKPIDANANRIADVWEKRYFGAAIKGVAEEDADHDGMSNRAEYLAGTSPIDPQSFFCIERPVFNDGKLTLNWNTKNGRTYRIIGTTDISNKDAWTPVAGPWEAAAGQTLMSWTETNLYSSGQNHYRAEVLSSD